jgi:CRISPR-associated endonuclease Csn1
MSLIVPVLADQGLIYSDAVHELKDDSGNPLHHSLRDDGRRWSRLPYYGEVLTGSMLGANPSIDPFTNPEKHFGKINNPTVHVALNSLRRVVNTLIDRFGSVPSEIHIELTRDLKLPRKRRDEINADQARNQRENERIKKFCAEHGIVNPSANDIRKVRLWEELGKDQFARCCVYSGKPISAAQLFNGDAEIEHILPFSRTLDRSLTNLTLSMRWANRLKGNRSPFDAFHGDIHAKSGIIWQEVLQRISRLPKEKRNRFSEDAMKKFDDDTGFIARQLNDTAYMARMAARYLKSLDGVEHVLSNPGRLTALVRGKWHLNGILSDDNLKSRNDHRHHAVDAAVIALTDRSLLNEISRLSSRGADDRLHIAVPTLDRNLEENIRTRIPKIITAFKPDHGLQGSMYNDTAYGFVQVEKRDPDLPNHNLVMRKDLIALTPSECGAICDRNLRAHVQAYLSDSSKKGVKHEIALAEFSKEREIKRTRIFVANQTVAPIPSAPFKGYAPSAYACCDIWCIPPVKKKAKKAGKSKWQGVFWPYAETVAGDPDKKLKKPHPAARFVTRLFKDDLIAYEIDGGTQIMRVAGFSTTNNKLDVRFHFSANSDQNYISINVLGTLGLRKLFISPDGQILETRRRGSK